MCKAPHNLVVDETVLERDAVRSKEVPYAEQERLPPWTMKDIRWPMAIYISACHLLALAGICMIPSCKTATLLWTAALWPIGGFGITGAGTNRSCVLPHCGRKEAPRSRPAFDAARRWFDAVLAMNSHLATSPGAE